KWCAASVGRRAGKQATGGQCEVGWQRAAGDSKGEGRNSVSRAQGEAHRGAFGRIWQDGIGDSEGAVYGQRAVIGSDNVIWQSCAWIIQNRSDRISSCGTGQRGGGGKGSG